MKPVRGCARFFRLSFDGGCREGIMGVRWVLQQTWRCDNGGPIWHPGPAVALRVPEFASKSNAIIAETFACFEDVSALLGAVGDG